VKRRRDTVRLGSGLALLVVLVLSQLYVARGSSDDGRVPVPREVRDRISVEGAVRVLVELRLPAGRHVPEGEFRHHAAAAVQRLDINGVQARLFKKLSAHVRVLHRYQTVPFIAVEVGPHGLAELEAAGFEAARVAEDRLVSLALSQSASIVQAPPSWTRGYDGGGTVVAIVDTGVDGDHRFLSGKVVEEACFSAAGTVASSLCPNGIRTQIGAGAARPCLVEGCEHGTHVAGIAAGNGAGHVSFSGIAPGARIAAYQVFSRIDHPSCPNGVCLGAFTSDIMAALDRIVTLRSVHNFAAVNLSLGSGAFTSACDTDPMKPLVDTLRSFGIATIAASGNQGHSTAISSPGCISSAVSVGATDKNDAVAGFSNIASFLSLFAPGVSINSSVPGDGFAPGDGTSMAAPHVTAAWAVLKQAVPSATVAEILSALQASGGVVSGRGVTKPRIRIAAALDRIGPPSIAWETPPPVTATSGQTFTVSWTRSSNLDHIHVHWDPLDPTAAGCCAGGPTSPSGSTGTLMGTPTTLTAPGVATTTTIRYAAHVRNAGNGQQAFTAVVPVVVTPLPGPTITWATPPPSTLRSGQEFEVSWTRSGGVNHIHVHWDPADPTAPGCCTSGNTSGSSATLLGSPATLRAPLVTTPTTIRYVVHIANSAGQEGFSTVIPVTVTPPPPLTIAWETPPPATLASGQQFEVSWTRSGGVNHIHVHWDPVDPTAAGCCSGGNTSGSSGTFLGSPTTLRAPTVTTPTTIRYAAHVTNAAGQEGFSSVVAVTVSPPPPPTIAWETPPPATLRSGQEFTVSWTRSGGVNHVHVHWDPVDPTAPGCCPAGGNTSGSSASFLGSPAALRAPVVSTPTTIRYVAHVGNAAGQEGFSTVAAVTVSPPPPPTIAWATPPPATVASGQEFEVSWTRSGGLNHIHVHWDPDDPTAPGCCTAGNTSASSGTFLGSPATLRAPVVATPTTIRYVAHVGNAAGQQGFSAVVPVLVNPPPAPTIRWETAPPSTLASGQQFEVSWTRSGGVNHIHVHWDPVDPTAPGCCTAGNTSGSSGTFLGSPATLRAPIVSTPTTIRYVAHVGNAAGQQGFSIVVPVLVNPPPAPTIAWETPPPARLVSGQQFEVSWTRSGGVNHIHVHWDPVDPTAPGCCTAGNTSGSSAPFVGTPITLTAPVVTAPTTIRYVAHIGDAAGQQGFSAVVVVTVVPAPVSSTR
jgi:subtilisin family serine protease